MSIRRASLSWAILIAGFPAVVAFAQAGEPSSPDPSGGGGRVFEAGGGNEHPIPESERWATITHPGNEPFVLPPLFPGDPPRLIGRVDYEYQISRTEVTGAEWLEFVNAYSPYLNPEYINNSEFTGDSIGLIGSNIYGIIPGYENRSIEVGWRFAARYVNWLHNDKGTEREDFEDGAYDTSTFGDSQVGLNIIISDQVAHHADARYWIPTHDEWIKASHWDPARYGTNDPGYWLYSHTSDEMPRFGSPESGGQTSTGHITPQPDVAAYRDVMSPWGLWDTSGGADEWTETIGIGLNGPEGRYTDGTSRGDPYLQRIEIDRVDRFRFSHPRFSVGLRVARAVPGAGSAWAFVCAFSFALRRRRQNDETHSSHPRRRAGAGAPFLER